MNATFVQSLEEELYQLGIFLLASKIQYVLLFHFSWFKIKEYFLQFFIFFMKLALYF